MIIFKKFAMIATKNSFPSLRAKQMFTSKKINDLAEELSERINREQIIKAETEENILKNYI